jgi:hypothetical protein
VLHVDSPPFCLDLGAVKLRPKGDSGRAP